MSSTPHEKDYPNVSKQTLSLEEIQEFSRDFERLESAFRDMLTVLDPRIRKRWSDLAGPQLESMLLSPKDALKFLADADPKLRKVAIQVSYQYWEITSQAADIYERMARFDFDEGVRNSALAAVGTSFSRTKDRRIGAFLAAIIQNNEEPDFIRLTAFTSLLRVHGNMDYGLEGGKSPMVPLSLGEIDIAFVDKYRNPA